MKESDILRVIDGLDQMMEKKLWSGEGISETFYELSMALACIFALFLIAKVLYRPMTGRGSIDFLELGKPFLIGLVLANWFLITEAIFGLPKPLETFFRDKYEMDVEELDKKREERLVTAKKLDNMVADKKVENDMNETLSKSEKAEKNLDNTDYANEAGTEEIEAEHFSSYNPMEHLGTKMMVGQSWLMNWIEKGLLWIAEVFWCVSVFLVFLSKHIATVVLVMFGPIFVSTSILWPDNFKKWLSLSINVSFYGVIAFMVMTLCLKFIKYGIQADINQLNDTIKDEMSLMAYIKYTAGNGFGMIGMYVLTIVSCSLVMLMVPELASWVFPSEIVFRGASDFQKGVKNGMQELAVATASFVAGTVTGGIGTGVQMALKVSDKEDSGSETSLGDNPADGDGGDGPKPGGDGAYFATDNPKQKKPAASSRTSRSTASSVSSNSWYSNVLADEKRMSLLRTELEAYEEALSNGTVDEFMTSLNERHPEWDRELQELKLGDQRDEFWKELKEGEKRQNVLNELDELLKKYEDDSKV